jgi:dienelactone hydrolase
MPIFLCLTLLAAEPVSQKGTCAPFFANRTIAEANAARLTPPATPFAWELAETYRDDGVTISTLKFPSPVKSPYECNNTVWCEYHCPRNAAAGAPAAVVLHFLYDKDFTVTRVVTDSLARRGIPALMLKMAYYGERRPAGLPADMTESLDGLVAAWLQSAQDIRRAVAWLEARPEADPRRIGLVGISLGAFVGSLVLGVDANVDRAVLVLGGGNLNEVLWTAPETRQLRATLRARSLTREATAKLLQPIEPLGVAAPLPPGTLLMINARNDTTVPPPCTRALAEAFKADDVQWYDTTHTGLGANLFTVLDATAGFLARPRAAGAPTQGDRK